MEKKEMLFGDVTLCRIMKVIATLISAHAWAELQTVLPMQW